MKKTDSPSSLLKKPICEARPSDRGRRTRTYADRGSAGSNDADGVFQQTANIGVILCGGLGERFWPLSDETRPKYALPFAGKKTLLAATYDRLRTVHDASSIYVITAKEHAGLVKKLLPGLAANRILAEPARRNTAGAVTLATLLIAKARGQNAVITFYPADAMIRNSKGFAATLKKAQSHARTSGRISVIGILPTYPATGYGYIEAGKKLGAGSARAVGRFVEKPPLARAKRMFGSRRFWWNAGIFVWTASVFADEMKRHASGYFGPFAAAFSGKKPSGAQIAKIFKSLPAAPIDRLLVEKTRRLAVFAADFDWDDVGTWDSLRRIAPDAQGNVIGASGIFENVKNSVIFCEDLKVAACGVQDLVIAQKGRHLLICGPGQSQEVRRLKAAILKNRKA